MSSELRCLNVTLARFHIWKSRTSIRQKKIKQQEQLPPWSPSEKKEKQCDVCRVLSHWNPLRTGKGAVTGQVQVQVWGAVSEQVCWLTAQLITVQVTCLCLMINEWTLNLTECVRSSAHRCPSEQHRARRRRWLTCSRSPRGPTGPSPSSLWLLPCWTLSVGPSVCLSLCLSVATVS